MLTETRHKTLTPDSAEIKDFLESIHTMVKQEVGMTTFLLDSGIHDSLATYAAEFLSNPLQTSFKSLEMLEQSIREQIEEDIMSLFQKNKKYIAHAYKTQQPDLYYCLALKKDTLGTRRRFYEFLTRYEQTALAGKFPIHFQFIPKDVVLALPDFNEVNV